MRWLTRSKSRSLKSRQIFACVGNLGKVWGLLKINLGRVVESYKSPELCSLKFCVFIFNIICCICVKIVNKFKCSIASDVLTSLAPLLPVHVSAVLSRMTLLCPIMFSSPPWMFLKRTNIQGVMFICDKALSSKYVYSLEDYKHNLLSGIITRPKILSHKFSIIHAC